MNKLFVLIVGCAFAGSVLAEEPKMDPKKMEMMKAWKEASTPGPEHTLLKGLAGKWKVTTQSWESETAKPEKTTGTSTFKPLLGGRFVQQDFKGKMMGMPYEGTGNMGFNNVSKKFESTWQDSMSTELMTFEGTMDDSSKTIASSGEFECPIKKTTQKMRSEMKIIDKDTMTFALYMPDLETGKEFKGMEQTYKRMK